MMSLPKTVLSSPIQNESQGTSLNSATPTKCLTFPLLKFEETVEKSRLQLGEQEALQKRLGNLRKELDYLQETAWKYQPIDKYIGQ
ncbi:hypothetical protein LSTR_LSTR014289 [Laodelphax striatellus]|uniref:Uncharacterized protein n=1 Tax=Laodelphax striatellus TaxID=195883 RepID=A0A482WQ87_LAOST|nr:hypothetical protein LSTR_LSTR014289 [Laodelphax striatellus]